MRKIKPKILTVILSVLVLTMAISPTYPTLIPAYAVEVTPVLGNKCDLSAEPDKPISPDCELLNLIIAEEAARIAADIVLQNNIDAEEAARIAADANLQSQIDVAVSDGQAAIVEAKRALAIGAGLFAAAAAGCAVFCPASTAALSGIAALLGVSATVLDLIDFVS